MLSTFSSIHTEIRSKFKEEFGKALKDLKYNLSWFTNRFLTTEILTVSLTKRCNLNCTYCWDFDNRPTIKEMETSEIMRLIDSAHAAGAKVFNPFGGEPFLRKDALTLIEYAFSKGLRVSVTTNGTLINKEMCERLVASCPGDRLAVLVSLDGATAEENDIIRSLGSFDKTTNFIRHFDAERRRQGKFAGLIINCVISRNNFRSMLKMVNLTRDLGADLVHFITPVVSSSKVIRGMRENNLVITPNDFEELDSIIDEILQIKKRENIILNNPTSLNNFKQYYRRQYEQLKPSPEKTH